MLFREVLVLGLAAEFEPNGDKILKQLLGREIEIPSSREASSIESLEPRAKAPRQRSVVKLRMFVKALNGHRLGGKQGGDTTKLCEQFVAGYVAVVNL